MKSLKLAMVSLLSLAGLFACSSAREVEVSGEVSAAQSISSPISLEFYELEDADDAERNLIKEVELPNLGAFNETVEVAEDILIVVALVDMDQDGACSPGDLWAEAQREAKDDGTFEPFTLTLTSECPPTQ